MPLVPAVTQCLLCLLLLCVSLQNTSYYLVCAFYTLEMIHASEISLFLLFFIQHHVLKLIHVHIHAHLDPCSQCFLSVCPWHSESRQVVSRTHTQWVCDEHSQMCPPWTLVSKVHKIQIAVSLLDGSPPHTGGEGRAQRHLHPMQPSNPLY